MSFDGEDANETQQLMQNEGEEEEQKVPQPATSPVTSNKLSSGPASFTSRSAGGHLLSSTGNESSKVTYINERKTQREHNRSNYNHKPKQIPVDAPDVKHKALLKMLDDFQTGKLSAFSAGCSMEQMINIRDQQEHLARLHFRLCGNVEKPDNDLENSDSQEKMSQLVHSLEQLSASIENLHANDSKSANGE